MSMKEENGIPDSFSLSAEDVPFGGFNFLTSRCKTQSQANNVWQVRLQISNFRSLTRVGLATVISKSTVNTE